MCVIFSLIFVGYDNPHLFNTLRPRQNGRHFADDIFKCIFLNENVWIPIKISLKFVPKRRINNIPGLVQIMAWRRPGDKPLSEPMLVSLTTHICVTRPQWVNAPSWIGVLVHTKNWSDINSQYRPFVGANHPWPVDSPDKGPVMPKEFPFHDVTMRDWHRNTCLHLDQWWFLLDVTPGKNSSDLWIRIQQSPLTNMNPTCRLQYGGHFILDAMC